MKNHISNLFRSIGEFVKNNKIWSIILAAVIICGGYYTYSKLLSATATVTYTYGRIRKGDLVISVSGSGQVATLSKVLIKPTTTGQTQTLGQIISVKVKNGDNVKAGQVVAILDGKNALQSLNQAEASVASAQANYNKLINGLTDADKLSLNNSITSAQNSLDNTKQNILIKLKAAYTSATNDTYLNTDGFFLNPNGESPLINLTNVSYSNQQLQTNVNQGRIAVGQILNVWRDEIKTMSLNNDMPTLINNTIDRLNKIRNYFDDMTTLLSVYGIGQNSTAVTLINSSKSTASSARGDIDSLISDLTSTLQTYNSNVFSLKTANDNLSVKSEPPSTDDIAVSKANLDNAKANLANAQTAYASRIITAPFDGQIGGLTADVGQQVSSSDSLGTLITAEKVINVTLNEVDAAKVATGDSVTITFDSLPDVKITGKVSYIDPLGTVSQGVVSYSVQIKMDEQNDQIKTAMTASVSIATETHQNVLMIPTSAITTTGGKKYVLVADVSTSTFTDYGMRENFNNASSSTREMFASSTFASSTFSTSSRRFRDYSSSTNSISTRQNVQYPVIQVEITTGISNNTNTEVLSGLEEGQMIVVRKSTNGSSTTAKSTATSATTNTRGGFGGGFGGGAVGATMIRD